MSLDCAWLISIICALGLGLVVGIAASGDVVTDNCKNFGAFAKGNAVYSCTARS